MSTLSKKDLIHRLNRVSGQINGIKKSIEEETPVDCRKTLQQLKASINALKKFGEAYVNFSITQCLEQMPAENIKEELEEVISSAFSL